MKIAVMKESTCIDIIVFSGLPIAQSFMAMNVWPDADAVVELPEGYGIGDSLVGGIWTRNESRFSAEYENGADGCVQNDE